MNQVFASYDPARPGVSLHPFSAPNKRAPARQAGLPVAADSDYVRSNNCVNYLRKPVRQAAPESPPVPHLFDLDGEDEGSTEAVDGGSSPLLPCHFEMDPLLDALLPDDDSGSDHSMFVPCTPPTSPVFEEAVVVEPPMTHEERMAEVLYPYLVDPRWYTDSPDDFSFTHVSPNMEAPVELQVFDALQYPMLPPMTRRELTEVSAAAEADYEAHARHHHLGTANPATLYAECASRVWLRRRMLSMGYTARDAIKWIQDNLRPIAATPEHPCFLRMVHSRWARAAELANQAGYALTTLPAPP